ncbi:MAG: TonB-dependent siderophore receptor [Bacteroidota bacterium]
MYPRKQIQGRLVLFVLMLLVSAADVAAQSGSIQGIVRDAGSDDLLGGVNVGIVGTTVGAATGPDGRFTMTDVPAGEHTLRVSLIGYAPVEQAIQVRAGETTVLSAELSEEAVELGSISVTGRRSRFVAETITTASKIGGSPMETPYSVSVITQDQLEVQAVDNLAEALRYTPGTQGERWGLEPRFTWVSIRGFDVSETGLYRDGLQLRNPSFAVGYNMEPYGAERIEVLRGPASVLYGAGNPGGIVSLITKQPTIVPLRELEVQAGIYGRYEGRFDVSGPLDEANAFSYRLTGLYRNSDTQVDFVGNDRLFLAPAFSWRPGKGTTWTLLGHYQRDETMASQALPAAGILEKSAAGKIPVSRFTGEPDVDQYDRTEYTVSSLFEHRFGERVAVQQKMRYYSSDLDDVTVYATGLQEDGRTLSRAVYGSYGRVDGVVMDQHARGTFALGAADVTLLGGVDVQRIRATSNQTWGAAPGLDIFDPSYGQEVVEPPVFADFETQQQQVGLYAQSQIDVAERLIISLNGRHDWAHAETEDFLQEATSEQDDAAFTGRAGLIYESALGLAPYASYATSFLPAIGVNADGDPFEPERGRQVEVGLKYQPPGVNSFVTAAYYNLTRDNFLQYDPSTWLQVQTGQVRSRGVEVEGTASLWMGLDVIAGLTQQNVEITESAVAAEVGEQPSQVPERTASLWASYTFPQAALRGVGLGAGVRHLGATYGDVPNTLEAPSATLADATIYYERNGLRFAVNVQNVFDEEYVAAAFMRTTPLVTFGPARQITGSIRYNW